MNLRVLIFGDVMGGIGRKAIAKILPKLKKELKPDLIIANAENIAHGKGITQKTLEELKKAGVDFFTSGDHVFDKKEIIPVLEDKNSPLIRPANYPPLASGFGYKIVEIGIRKILMINLIGRVFMKGDYDCPFRKFDQILEETKNEKLNAVIVDFHTEATSEIRAFSFYADGRASIVFGTHTHVPTSDNQILAEGTGYVSDVGMAGAKDSVLGVDKENIIKNFLTQMPFEHQIPETGKAIINAIFLEINPKNKKAEKIKRVDKEVEI
ncbi:MAG: hypothetical protein Athens101410_648 [Parcubacteria group bacterium Athens1014_10]|nr:MAG: hypothetical protein Athens101410_648 [Parcubacteria group bacterium Athens1014_10]TSD05195.1 MAG: hypothetical protein Athens071412_393 [Parcubacteria group bacterium Athens0714_12]